MYSNTFKPIGNLVKAAFLTGAFICSQASSLWASGAPELTEAEKKIVQRVSNLENAGLTQTAVKLLPQDQRTLTDFGAVLGCDMPIVEALYHVLKPQPITSDEYQAYQGLIQKDPNLLNLLHEDLRKPMRVLVAQDIASTKLVLVYEEFKAIPSGIFNYTHLTMLDLLCNRLTQLPREIGQLAALQELDLSRNQLTHLPAEIGQLAALQKLYLSGNRLTQLPSEIGQLGALQKLYLSRNQLPHLPAEIGQLAALQKLDLSRNPLFAGLDTSTAVQGYVNGADHIREMFPRTTNIIFTFEQLDSRVKIFGTRD